MLKYDDVITGKAMELDQFEEARDRDAMELELFRTMVYDYELSLEYPEGWVDPTDYPGVDDDIAEDNYTRYEYSGPTSGFPRDPCEL